VVPRTRRQTQNIAGVNAIKISSDGLLSRKKDDRSAEKFIADPATTVTNFAQIGHENNGSLFYLRT